MHAEPVAVNDSVRPRVRTLFGTADNGLWAKLPGSDPKVILTLPAGTQLCTGYAYAPRWRRGGLRPSGGMCARTIEGQGGRKE